MTLCCWLIADTVNVYVSHALLDVLPAGPSNDSSAAPPVAPASLPDATQMAKAVLSAGLFVVPAKNASLDPDAEDAPAPPPPPPLELVGKLKLLGTALRDGGRSAAVIENLQDHKQALYFLEETIEGFGRLALITREGVTIKQGNRQGDLPLADETAKPMPIATSAAPKRTSTPVLIDRLQLKQNLSDVSKLLTEARAMPYYDLTNNGKLEGWQLIEIKPKSILDQLGIQQRDVMLRINGTPVVDPGTMLRLLQEIQHEHVVKVDLIRSGERQTFTYEIR
jgi:type II secretion system protein C